MQNAVLVLKKNILHIMWPINDEKNVEFGIFGQATFLSDKCNEVNFFNENHVHDCYLRQYHEWIIDPCIADIAVLLFS